MTGSWEVTAGRAGLTPLEEGRLQPGLSMPDSPRLELELAPSSLSRSIISPAGGGPRLLKYSDGLMREFPSPFRLGNLGGMKGSTM